jgi:hypothetical protein
VVGAGDDPVAEHQGHKVYGKARPRDAVRSTPSDTACRWGHQGVVLAIRVRFPFATRSWALPVLVALYRSEQEKQRLGRRQQTPVALRRQLLSVWAHWFPERRFLGTVEGPFATHELARFAARQRRRLTLVRAALVVVGRGIGNPQASACLCENASPPARPAAPRARADGVRGDEKGKSRAYFP